MTKTLPLLITILASLFLVSCSNTKTTITPELPIVEFKDTFENSTNTWTSTFLGHTDSNKEDFNFQSEITAIPDLNSKGLMLSANNPNGQLAIITQKKLSGLSPNQDYNLLYIIALASNLSSDNSCPGLVGKRTAVKIAAGVKEPKLLLEENLEVLDLGTGPFQRVGDVGHQDRACEATDYAINQLGNLKAPFNAPLKITSDANGESWAAIVLDSSFVGQSTFYIDSIDITATPVAASE